MKNNIPYLLLIQRYKGDAVIYSEEKEVKSVQCFTSQNADISIAQL